MESYARSERELQEELAAKNELLEEANSLIEAFNDEKHELKAKFKFIMPLLQASLGDDSVEASSYKPSDDIDLNQCFEVLEEELVRLRDGPI